MTRPHNFFPPGDYNAQFLGLSTSKAGRVRLRFLVLNDEQKETENICTDKDWPEGTAFEKDFVNTFHTTPYGLRNKTFKVKVGTTFRGYSTVLCYEPHDFILPVWFREKQDRYQAAPGAKAAYVKKREAIDPKFRTANALRKYVWESLILGKDHAEILGCDSQDLRWHIEKQFEQGWNWKNYATAWEVDHEEPLSRFDLTNPEEVKKAAHYSNLRPYDVKRNREKYNAPAAPLLVEEELI